ncbi:MAG: hypothetical protein Q9165_007218 [Trypethelium subeluteriae]
MSQVAVERKIDLWEDDPDVVHAMLHYLYNFDYNDRDIDQHGSVSRMPFNIRVFALVHKYDIEPLKIFARGRFKELTKCEPSGDGFSRAVKLLYEGTEGTGTHEKNMRADLVKYAWMHYQELLDEDPGFRTVLTNVTGFAADVATECSAD